MTVAQDRKAREAGRVRWLYRAVLASSMLALLGGAEWTLRSIGMGPWQPVFPRLTVEPGGKLTRLDAMLGYGAIPGSFIATDHRGMRTRYTHLSNGRRITRPLADYGMPADSPEIWIFGGSFTYGSGLDDDETFPWRLQERLPDHEVVNYGMGGYGTVQAFLQLREGLERTSPGVAILAYASFHDVRNTFLRARRKMVAPFSRLGPLLQPYARLDGAGRLTFHFARTEYDEFPLMRRLALAHLLESAFNAIELRVHDSAAVTEALVLEMARLSRERGTVFVLADISEGARMRRFAADHGIPSVDISLPRTLRYTLGPHDPHPNARAARIYAERLERFLAPILGASR